MRALLLLPSGFLAAAVLAGCASPGPGASDGESAPAEVGRAIDAAWLAHVEAAVAKDLEGVLAVYAEDIVYVVGGERVVGLPAVAEMEAAALASSEVLAATHTTLDLRVFDDVAYEIGTVVGPVRSAGAERATEVRFPFMAQWVRGDDGAWKLRCLVGR